MADQQASSSTTAAPAGGAATESTPLLQATSTDDPSPAPAPPSSPEATSNTGVDKFTYVLITASVFLGPITIALALAMLVVLTASPGGDEFSMSYRLREAWVGITGIVSPSSPKWFFLLSRPAFSARRLLPIAFSFLASSPPYEANGIYLPSPFCLS